MKMKTRKINLLFLGIISMLLATSCLKDDPMINWDEGIYTIVEFAHTSHNVRLTNVNPSTDRTFTPLYLNYTIPWLKDHTSDIVVNIGIDESLVAKYNTAQGLNGSTIAKQPYTVMPSSAYTLPATLTIPAGVRTLTWSLDLKTAGLERGQKYIIPVVINGAPAGITISGNFGHLLLRADMVTQ